MSDEEFKLVSSIPDVIRLVRVKKQPPNVTHYIEGYVGIVMESKTEGGRTWLDIMALKQNGDTAGSGWLWDKYVEDVTDPEWVRAAELFVKQRKEYEAQVEASTRQRNKAFKELAARFLMSEETLREIQNELDKL